MSVVHRLDHIVDELADAAVDVFDLPRLLPKDGVRRVYQRQDGQLRYASTVGLSVWAPTHDACARTCDSIAANAFRPAEVAV